MNFGYNNGNFANPYARTNYGMPNYFQQFTQQPQQQMQQQVQYEMPIQYLGYGTLQQAETYIISPNSKGIFIDKANGMYYEKTTNNDGVSTIQKFKRVEDINEQKVEEQKPIDLSNFLTKQDYDVLLQKIQQLEKNIGGRNNVSN